MVAMDLDARPESLVFHSSENQVALVELFTSEGCSSCPPAETWLSSLKAAPGLWKEFVPVAFHVDYWDHLGWRDPWGAKSFSDRQRAHAQNWRGDSIYTPGFVLNGQEWRAWSPKKTAPQMSATKAGVLQVSSADRAHWQVTFSSMSKVDGGYEVHAAILANELSSDVKAGENRGRRLNHDFVVVALTTHPLTKHGDKAEGEFALQPDTQKQKGRLAIAFWVTHRGSLEPLQAAGGWLPN